MKLAFGVLQQSDDEKKRPQNFWYTVNTIGGSSGSPCFTQDLRVVGLHHYGGTGQNRGIRSSFILPLIEHLLTKEIGTAPEAMQNPHLRLPKGKPSVSFEPRHKSLVAAGDEIGLNQLPYVERKCHDEALSRLASDYPPLPIFLKGRRRTGKSSLLLRIVDQAGANIKPILRFPRHPHPDLINSEEKFCCWFVQKLTAQIGEGVPHWGIPPQRVDELNDYIETNILPKANGGLMLAIDDVDALLEAAYFQSFLAAIHSWYSLRYERPIWMRFSFVGTISFDHDFLVKSGTMSPFVRAPTFLDNFEDKQMTEMGQQMGLNGKPQLLKDIFEWVGGNPYLVHALIERALVLAAQGRNEEEVMNEVASGAGPITRHVDHLCTELESEWDLLEAFAAMDPNDSMPLPNSIGKRLLRLGLVILSGPTRYKISCNLYRILQRNMRGMKRAD